MAPLSDIHSSTSECWDSNNHHHHHHEIVAAEADHQDFDGIMMKVNNHHEEGEDFDEIMEIDEQIGSNLLGDDIFGGEPNLCVSPIGPLEELTYTNTNNIDLYIGDDEDYDSNGGGDFFFVPFLEDTEDEIVVVDESTTTPDGYYYNSAHETSSQSRNSMSIDEMYEATLKNLQESMKRSEETRRSLTMKTPKTIKYERSKSITGVITSIEKSSSQVQHYYLKHLNEMKLQQQA